MGVSNYVDDKEIKVKELKEKFSLVKEFEIECGYLSACGNCGNSPNTKRLPSQSWTSALYCWKCNSITVMYHADRMSGNCKDQYEVYQ